MKVFLTIERGRGTFVTNSHIDKDLVDLREQKLHALVSSMFAEVVYLSYEPDEVAQVLDAYVEQWRSASKGTASEIFGGLACYGRCAESRAIRRLH